MILETSIYDLTKRLDSSRDRLLYLAKQIRVIEYTEEDQEVDELLLELNKDKSSQ